MFYKVLKIFQVQELYKKGGKGNVKGGAKMAEMAQKG
jgi:hypothetical protein